MRAYKGLSILCSLLVLICTGMASGAYTVFGWNNLGMHCMDANFSVFCILPPYNSIFSQVIDSQGLLLNSPGDINVSYQAISDSSGSINTTSNGKTDFWQYVNPLFGASLPVDVGLPVPGPNSFAMPGPTNLARRMEFDNSFQWFDAYGIPITPFDDSGKHNPYPMMRLTAKLGAITLAHTDIVLPVSDEMDCSACHRSGAGPAAKPSAGWVYNPEKQRDYRLNILRLHDELSQSSSTFHSALATVGYDANSLYATVVVHGTPILCASCHLSEALPGSGLPGIAPLTEAVHNGHADVNDPTNGLKLNSVTNRSACYRCHPGSQTRCLRGAMGKAVAADGNMLMQCQSCHGSMSLVGSATRTGWLNEPNCQSCHTGTATQNNGQIRYTSIYDSNGNVRHAVNQTFATNPDTPAAGLSLYRFSRGHGGMYCEACHGSTHAEFPTSQINDNIYSTQHQGHEGMLVECQACHVTVPSTVSGGPHGLHPIDQSWVYYHHDVVSSNPTSCRACHGTDYTGTVLSYAKDSRTFDCGDLGTKSFWPGYRIGCYSCHNGPSESDPNPNRPPVVSNALVTTTNCSAIAIPLSATDPDGNPLTLRIVSQPAYGTVGLTGTTATYFPERSYIGSYSFTFAAWDGQLNSNLGTVTVNVTPSALTADLNCDNKVNLADLDLFVEQWLEAGCVTPEWCSGTDLNRNSKVDFIDFAVFAQQWIHSL